MKRPLQPKSLGWSGQREIYERHRRAVDAYTEALALYADQLEKEVEQLRARFVSPYPFAGINEHSQAQPKAR